MEQCKQQVCGPLLYQSVPLHHTLDRYLEKVLSVIVLMPLPKMDDNFHCLMRLMRKTDDLFLHAVLDSF
jgi:hypothetical protein